MRLWHQDLIPKLPRLQLQGQHRECCALRGNGWGKKHSTVDYVFRHNPYKLVQYHRLIILEMISRGYNPDLIWDNAEYRGKQCSSWEKNDLDFRNVNGTVYKEHNNDYMQECLKNLIKKEIFL